MELNYTLEEEDFLTYQLYHSSQNPDTDKKKNNGRIYIAICFCILAGYFYIQKRMEFAISFVVFAVIGLVFYERYFKWRYKTHFSKHIKQNYQGRIGQPVLIRFEEDTIYSKDKTGEGTLKIAAVDHATELPEHVLLKLSSDITLIIPKRGIEDFSAFETMIRDYQIKWINQYTWTW